MELVFVEISSLYLLTYEYICCVQSSDEFDEEGGTERDSRREDLSGPTHGKKRRKDSPLDTKKDKNKAGFGVSTGTDVKNTILADILHKISPDFDSKWSTHILSVSIAHQHFVN